MILTIDALFQEPAIFNAIIDRALETSDASISHKRYLKYHDAKAMFAKSAIGVVSRSRAGSMIDQYSEKPLRTRPEVGTGSVQLGTFGDKFQIDNQRIDDLQDLVNLYNAQGTDKAAAINTIADFLANNTDVRELLLAPQLAIDILMGSARSKGVFEVNIAGAEAVDITLPVRHETATQADIKSIVSYLAEIKDAHKKLGNVYTLMQMNSRTFRQKFMKSDEMSAAFATKFGDVTMSPTPLVQVQTINDMLIGAGLGFQLELDDQVIELADGSVVDVFADNKIALLPSANLGQLEYHKDTEWTRSVTGVTKLQQGEAGSILISTESNKNGIFTDYKMNAVPNISNPSKMAIIDVSASLS